MKLGLMLFVAALPASGQDTRKVVEPTIPIACTTITAQLTTAISDEIQLDTKRIQQAMDTCAPGKAVVLSPDTTHNAFLTGTARDLLPVFEDITLRNVRIEGAGKVTLDGFDGEHPLKMFFDNVIYDGPGAINTSEKNSIIQHRAGGPKNSCEGKFIPFPGDK